MTGKPRVYEGQALVEYLWVIVVIALVCIPASMFLNQAQQQTFAASSGALNVPALGSTTAKAVAPTATPTPTVSSYNVPSTDEDCKKGGWETFYTPAGTFKNQGDCVSWVQTNGRNAPANP